VDSLDKTKQRGDLRDYLAAERTFLAWIRTGLALMGFGFVVARFALFSSNSRRSKVHRICLLPAYRCGLGRLLSQRESCKSDVGMAARRLVRQLRSR